jgi:hypothetical protein
MIGSGSKMVVWIGGVAALTGLLACADALQLQPPPGGGTGTATSSGTGGTTSTGGSDGTGGTTSGGGGGPACVSNSDCAEPTNVCDIVKNTCVECLELADCGHMPGTVCDAGVCACPDDETYCGVNDCVDAMTDPNNCGACGIQCFGACSAGVCNDPWKVVSVDGAPIARDFHTAVWTGTHMIVWGGFDGAAYLNTGGIYDPATNTWEPTSIVNAPSGRRRHTAVWTGTHMIVWGGEDAGGAAAKPQTGGLFDPATNTWTQTSLNTVPEGRTLHTAVWSGTQMLVFGGVGTALTSPVKTGGIYDPAADTWAVTAQALCSRRDHAAVWDDAAGRMIVYGGLGADGTTIPIATPVELPATPCAGGAAYVPGGAWTDVNLTDQPSARRDPTAVWTGTEMLVFGGFSAAAALDTGSKLAVDTWTGFTGIPQQARTGHRSAFVATPAVMVTWGGLDATAGVAIGTGDVFDPVGNAWSKIVPNALTARQRHSMVATADSVIIWGGLQAAGGRTNTGGIYTP